MERPDHLGLATATIAAEALADNKLSSFRVPLHGLWTNAVSAGQLREPVDAAVSTLQQQFGNLIRRRRHTAGLGQEALADKAEIHRTHVSLLERGQRMPSLLVIKKLAAALETTMASLMEELEREPVDAGEGEQEGPPPSKKSKTAKRKGS